MFHADRRTYMTMPTVLFRNLRRRLKILRSVQRVNLCPLYQARKKSIILQYIIDWFLQPRRVYLLRGTKWIFKYNSG
jgi:hypothetical protein